MNERAYTQSAIELINNATIDEKKTVSSFNSKAEENDLDILELRLQDYRWIVKHRKFFGYGILILLALQNIAVFGLMYIAYFQKNAFSAQILLSSGIIATTIETYYLVSFMIRWLFSNIDYKLYSQKSMDNN